jgi:hypothetical protein
MKHEIKTKIIQVHTYTFENKPGEKKRAIGLCELLDLNIKHTTQTSIVAEKDVTGETIESIISNAAKNVKK